MQIKTKMKHHLVLVRMAIIKKFTNNKCWRGCGEKGTFLHFWWECKLKQPLWRTVWSYLKKLEINFWGINHMAQQSHDWANHNSKGHMYPNVHCSTVYNSQDMKTT